VDDFCDHAKKLSELYTKHDTAVAGLKAKRTEKTPSAALIEDARTDIESLNKKIDQRKAAFDALDPHKRGANCEEDWVKEQARACLAGTKPSADLASIGAAATAGVSWQTAVVTGLAQFLQDRAQQEVVLWLVTQLQTEICSRHQTALLFPETCVLLD